MQEAGFNGLNIKKTTPWLSALKEKNNIKSASDNRECPKARDMAIEEEQAPCG